MTVTSILPVAAQIARRDFSAASLRALESVGVSLIGTQSLPAADGSWMNPQRAYVVDHRGTSKVWTHQTVLAVIAVAGRDGVFAAAGDVYGPVAISEYRLLFAREVLRVAIEAGWTVSSTGRVTAPGA